MRDKHENKPPIHSSVEKKNRNTRNRGTMGSHRSDRFRDLKEKMTPLKIQGSVQIWTMDTGMSEMKEAFVEIMQGEELSHLVVSFKLGDMMVFQLSNNITTAVVRYCAKGFHCLQLTLQSNTSLFIDHLSDRDAAQLKSFLDDFHPNKFRPLMKPKRHWTALESGNTGNIPSNTNDEPVDGPFNSTEGSGKHVPQKVPFSGSTPLTGPAPREVLESTGEKMVLSSGLEMNGDILQENNLILQKKSKTYGSKRRRSPHKTSMSLRGQKNHKMEPELPCMDSHGKPNPDKTVLLHSLFEISSLCPSESKPSQEIPVCNTEADEPQHSQPKELQLTGFPNLGNTCYMNVILQSLYAIPSLTEDLLKQNIPWEILSPEDFILPFSQLLVLKDICVLTVKEELLRQVKHSISKAADTFAGYLQNDAHEFLGQCLEELRENVENLNAICGLQEKVEGAEPTEPSAIRSAHPTAHRAFVCPVRANFQFELDISVVCEACGEVTKKTEVHNYLSVNLQQESERNPPAIQNILDVFFKPERVEHNCEKCKNKTSVLLSRLSRLPRVLAVHLKRYIFDDNWVLVKNQEPVAISKYLSLSAHCHESTRPPSALATRLPKGDSYVPKVSEGRSLELLGPPRPPSKVTSGSGESSVGPDQDAELPDSTGRSEGGCREPLGARESASNLDVPETENIAAEVQDPQNVTTGEDANNYRLISIVSHVGSSRNAGHYISDVYDFKNQRWLSFDDLEVTSVTEPFLQETRSDCGYIFFYMHNEIFEVLLKNITHSKLPDKQGAGDLPSVHDRVKET